MSHMPIESELVRELDFDDVINKFSSNKAKRKS